MLQTSLQQSVALESAKNKFNVKQKRRNLALTEILATSKLDEIQACHKAMDCSKQLAELDECAKMETKFYW